MLDSLPATLGAAKTLVTSAQSPNIAFIHITSTPYWQQLHREIARALPEVNLWSLYTTRVQDQPWELLESQDVRPVPFFSPEGTPSGGWGKAKADARKSSRLIAWLKEHDIKGVVVFGYNDVLRLRLIAWCKANGVACFLAADSNIKNEGERLSPAKKLIKRFAVSMIVGACSGVMPFGTSGVDYFRRYGARRDRIFPMPAGADYAMLASITADEIEAQRVRFNLDPARRRLIFTGRLVALKRVDLIVEAFSKAADERPDWDLVIVGDGPERAAIESTIPERLRSRVIFTGFVGDPRQLGALYRNCHALTLASNYEAWGLVVNEALASGLAVVTSDVVGASIDLVVGGYNGRTFKSGDSEDFAKALREVTNPKNIERMRAGSRAVIAAYRSRFDPIAGLRHALTAVGLLASGGRLSVDDANPLRASSDDANAGDRRRLRVA